MKREDTNSLAQEIASIFESSAEPTPNVESGVRKSVVQLEKVK
ncbi:hypothetical protein ACT54J_14040 [Leptospira interrogans]|uniref:Uncharacterized protein n=1 Tax=Leptospira interrogans serovar Hardjo str. Norma TaxID=1279460 RepID=A0A0M5L8G7_LEPIR|nr:hypothetical protein [Leptospira interrogans]ALE37848.1 hypothetical protein G436_0627 [Leptospira interrogans serovar Hardjo str. Norma]